MNLNAARRRPAPADGRPLGANVTHSLQPRRRIVRILHHGPLSSALRLSERDAGMCADCIRGVVKVHRIWAGVVAARRRLSATRSAGRGAGRCGVATPDRPQLRGTPGVGRRHESGPTSRPCPPADAPDTPRAPKVARHPRVAQRWPEKSRTANVLVGAGY